MQRCDLNIAQIVVRLGGGDSGVLGRSWEGLGGWGLFGSHHSSPSQGKVVPHRPFVELFFCSSCSFISGAPEPNFFWEEEGGRREGAAEPNFVHALGSAFSCSMSPAWRFSPQIGVQVRVSVFLFSSLDSGFRVQGSGFGPTPKKLKEQRKTIEKKEKSSTKN